MAVIDREVTISLGESPGLSGAVIYRSANIDVGESPQLTGITNYRPANIGVVETPITLRNNTYRPAIININEIVNGAVAFNSPSKAFDNIIDASHRWASSWPFSSGIPEWLKQTFGGDGPNVFISGTPSSDEIHPDGNYVPAKAVDGNTATRWSTYAAGPLPHWWSYDLGVGVTKKVNKVRIYGYDADITAFEIQGSNDNLIWDTLYIGGTVLGDQWNDFVFSNIIAYRHYRVYITAPTDDWYTSFWEIQAFESTPISRKTIVKYTLNNGGVNNGVIKDWTFEGSNDDVNWDILDTQTGQNPVNYTAYTFPNTTAYQHYRIVVTAINSGDVATIWEMEMMEFAD